MNWKTLKSNFNSDSISRALAKIIFCSFSFFIILLTVMLILVVGGGVSENGFIGKHIITLFIISGVILVYSCKIYLLIIPIVLCFQLKNYIKCKIKSDWIIKNICYWILLAFLSLCGHYPNVQEEECMKQCVLPDNSNFQECAFNTCDFVF